MKIPIIPSQAPTKGLSSPLSPLKRNFPNNGNNAVYPFLRHFLDFPISKIWMYFYNQRQWLHSIVVIHHPLPPTKTYKISPISYD